MSTNERNTMTWFVRVIYNKNSHNKTWHWSLSNHIVLLFYVLMNDQNINMVWEKKIHMYTYKKTSEGCSLHIYKCIKPTNRLYTINKHWSILPFLLYSFFTCTIVTTYYYRMLQVQMTYTLQHSKHRMSNNLVLILSLFYHISHISSHTLPLLSQPLPF